MRYYTKFDDVFDDYLYEITEEPWNVFATDLLYFFACEYKTGWIPYKVGKEVNGTLLPADRNYTPHPLSPFTNDMRRTVKYGILPPDEAFEATYNELVPPGAEDKLARFTSHLIEAFEDFFLEDRTMQDMYLILLYAGKLTTFFHLHGTPDAPQLAISLIASALLKLMYKIPTGKVFAYLQSCATIIRQAFENRHS